MWTAVLQPEENESDLERFADAPEADPDQTGLPTNATTPTAQDADGLEPPGTAPPVSAQPGQQRPEAASGTPAEALWPAEGAYDMSKRCVNAVLQPIWSPPSLQSKTEWRLHHFHDDVSALLCAFLTLHRADRDVAAPNLMLCRGLVDPAIAAVMQPPRDVTP